jgi:tetratricopeptide (TPR) repeat protein
MVDPIVIFEFLSGGYHIAEKIKEHKNIAELEGFFEEWLSKIETIAGMGHYSSSTLELVNSLLKFTNNYDNLTQLGFKNKIAKRFKARSLSILSHIAMNQGKPEKSIKLAELGLPLWDELGQKDKAIYLRNLKAISQRINGDLNSAIKSLCEAGKLVELINISMEKNFKIIHEVIEFYRNKSKALALKSSFSESIKLNNKALELSHKLADKIGNESQLILSTKDTGQILLWEGIFNKKPSKVHKGGIIINNSLIKLTDSRTDYNIADVVIKNALLEYLFIIDDSKKEKLMREIEQKSTIFGYGHEIEKVNKLKKQYGLSSK